MLSKLSLRYAGVALIFWASACGPNIGITEESDALKAAATKSPAPTYALGTTATYTTGAPVWQSSFTISSTYQVYFAFDLPASVSGSHTATFFLYAADGSLYQKNVLAFAAGTTASAGQQQAQKTATGYRIWTQLPVAGTFIQQYNMTGSWQSNVLLDSAATPNASVSFALN